MSVLPGTRRGLLREYHASVRRILLACVALTLVSACSAPSEASRLEVGDPAPPFSLPSADGGEVDLSEFRGSKPVLLYFSMGPG